MGKKITNEKLSREDGYLYYLGKDGYVWMSPMRHNKKGKKRKVGSEKVDRKKGFMYYVKDGCVFETKMKNA